ncbi:efflux RND transporter periplasmic adaptor subunit [Halomonas sp. HL-93]|uniref:efflux RND transporter periplasmic adaptor subunit n=1 Tax=Halomonas sp. HL-93 TaxID=1666906 RepID=UPI0006DA603B|nr:efflux RND transporter periplasmic adaptor subunit [Halomonas sp. HL-93]KPQ23695.1 MAG: RND family efflux transporter MFP component [Halomonas sp. HL-93]SBR47617.1 membrane fusion protein, multidrug efflux system [Halomonas sp. HL-93]
MPLFCRRLMLTLLLFTAPMLTHAQSEPSVIGVRAALAPWSDPLEALGTLRADESMTLSATVTDTIAEISFEDGQRVNQGDILIRLQDAEEQARLRAALALRDERRNALGRSLELQNRNLAARADVEDNQSGVDQAEAEIAALRARLEDYRLKAPFSGRVGTRNVSAGALVTPGMELITLDKLDVMKLDFSVPETYLSRLAPGLSLSATTAAFPDDVFHGEIASLGTRVDPVTRSISVRADIDNPDERLRPGMLMEVVVRQEPRESVVLPEAAIQPNGNRHYVMLIDNPDASPRLRQQSVEIGERRAGEVEINAGVSANDVVAVHGLQRARDGQAVRLVGLIDDETDVRDLLEADR